MLTKMKKSTKTVSAERIRRAFALLGMEICAGKERVNMALTGNTFSFTLNDCTVNVTISESKEGGAR